MSEIDSNEAATRRERGQGGIEHDRERGFWRGHYRDARSKRVRLPWCKTERDATEQLQAALELVAEEGGLSAGGVTLRAWGKDFLDKRELAGHRASKHDRLRWKYVLKADFIDRPLESISRRDIKRWTGQMNLVKTYGRGRPQAKRAKGDRRQSPPHRPLAWQTKAHALNLLRQAFVVAIEDEIVGEGFDNPCFGVKFKRPPTTEVPTNFFTRSEIERIQEKALAIHRPVIEFAIASGLRQGEMRALRAADVHADIDAPYMLIRYGKPPTKPTKGGHPREVPMLPMALRAYREWQAICATWCKNNYKGLAFPAQYGGYRSEGKMLGRRHQEIWTKLMADAGVRRHLVWHDLRHTCATALLGGVLRPKVAARRDSTVPRAR